MTGARARERLTQALAKAACVGGQLLDGLSHQPREVIPQPRMGLELEGVRRLVERDERAETVERDAQASGGGGDVGFDEIEPAPRNRRSSQQAGVVLPKHLARQEPNQESELLVPDRAVDDARQRLSRGLRASGRLVEEHLHPREERAERGQVEVDPFQAVDDRRGLERLRQRPTHLRLDRWLDRPQRLLVERQRLGAFAGAHG